MFLIDLQKKNHLEIVTMMNSIILKYLVSVWFIYLENIRALSNISKYSREISL